jgi:hypothetical protein
MRSSPATSRCHWSPDLYQQRTRRCPSRQNTVEDRAATVQHARTRLPLRPPGEHGSGTPPQRHGTRLQDLLDRARGRIDVLEKLRLTAAAAIFSPGVRGVTSDSP